LTHLRYWYEKFSLIHPFLNSLPDVSARRIARKCWWTS
jgi:hypothetical protein